METFTVQAVYKKGVLRPKTKLDLPEDSLVDVQVKLDKTQAGFGLWKDSPKSSLFGAFPELAAVSDADIKSAKKLWNKSLAKQSRIVKQAK